MTTFQFSDTPRARHQVLAARGTTTMVDTVATTVEPSGDGGFVVAIDGRHERLFAVAHGDAVYVQLAGRSHRLERVDATRSTASAASNGAGASHAPMPGVVVSIHTALSQPVIKGDALLVIESMKLQMTIAAPIDGLVAELPFAVGQTFQRNAVLVRVQAEEVSA